MVFIILIEALLATTAFFVLRNWEQQKLSLNFQRMADGQIAAIQKQLSDIKLTLKSVNALYLGSEYVERHEFSTFVSPLLSQNPAIVSIEWIPQLAEEEIKTYETMAHEDGLSNYLIKSRPKNNDFPSHHPAAYFPIYYMEPMMENDHWLGRDLASEPNYLTAMATAQNSNKMIASEFTGDFNRSPLRVFLPVYDHTSDRRSKNGGRQHHCDYIAARVAISKIIPPSLPGKTNNPLSIFVNPQSSYGGNKYICIYPFDSAKRNAVTFSYTDVIAASAIYKKTSLQDDGLEWELLITAGPEYFSIQNKWRNYKIAFAVMIITGIIAAFAHSSIQTRSQLSKTSRLLEWETREHRIAQQELKKEQDFKNTLIESSPIFFIVIDSDGHVTTVNRAILTATGFPATDLLGKNYLKVMATGEERDILKSVVHGFILSRTTVVNEFSFQTWKNRRLLVEWHLTPIYNSQEEFSHVLGIGIDVTERRKKEEDLKESEERYSKLIETSPDGIFICTLDGKILDANQSLRKMIGSSEADLKKMSYFELAHSRSLKTWTELPALITQKASYGPVEIDFVNKNGEVFPVSLNGWAIKHKKGHIDKLGFIVRDISEQKLVIEEKEKLMARLQQSQKMESIGTLAGGIAHDFNNILGIIIGYGELAKLTDLPENSRTETCIKEILAASARAKELVYQILTFSRQADQKREPIQLNSIVHEAVKFLRASIPSTIEIKCQIEDSCGRISANATQMHQIIMNLCTNAAHAMENQNDGMLNIILSNVEITEDKAVPKPGLTPGNWVKLTIKDSGHGIPEEDMDRIFEPYFTTKEKGQGTGLGLSVVHGIVESHDGVLHMESQLNQGTTFELFFPVVESTAISFKPVEENLLATGNERILFVDDEKHLVNIVMLTLQAAGYDIVGKTDSIVALEAFMSNPTGFDIVVTDMTMPKMTGLDLAQEIRQIRPNIPIILCTGFKRNISPEKLSGAGIQELLEKPFLPHQLTLTIRRTLDRIGPHQNQKCLAPLPSISPNHIQNQC